MTNQVLRVMTVKRIKPSAPQWVESDGTPSEVLIRDCKMERVEAIIGNDRREELLMMNKSQGSQVFKCCGLELPWRNNQQNISRIPAGIYVGIRERHGRYGWLYRLQNVPDRTGVLFGHIGNWAGDVSMGKKSNSEGCLILGTTFGDRMVSNSGKAIEEFAKVVQNGPGVCIVEVIDP